MRPLAWGAAVAVLAASGAAGSASAGCGDLLRFEPNPRLSVADVVGLGEFKGPDRSVAGRVLVGAGFQPGARPVRNGWTGLGVVYATMEGTPSDTEGGVVWTRRPELFGAEGSFADTPQGPQVRFAPLRPDPTCPAGLVIGLDAKGRLAVGDRAKGAGK